MSSEYNQPVRPASALPWREYLIEGWALGMFMVSACLFTVLIEHPDLPVRPALGSPLLRRFLIGLAMGLTAVLLIYSRWGKRSGAHMNPAVTLAFWQLDRIAPRDAAGYILAQFAGGYLGVVGCYLILPAYVADPSVNFAVTVPGPWGVAGAFFLEALLSFLLFGTVLLASNHQRLAPYTGFFAGAWLVVFITFEAPYSGMSINPARTVASALPAHLWTGLWLYFAAPIAGMTLAGVFYRRRYRVRHGGDCRGMKCHLSGARHDCPTYEVLGPRDLADQMI